MTAVAKYLFHVDFSAPGQVGQDQQIGLDEHRSLVEVAREQAKEQGRQLGLEEAQQAQAAEQHQALGSLLPQLASLLETSTVHRTQVIEDATALACEIGELLGGELHRLDPHRRLTGMIEDLLSATLVMPALVIKGAAADLAEIREELTSHPAFADKPDTINLVADATLSAGEWQVSWEGGGAHHSQADLLGKIKQALGQPEQAVRDDDATDDLPQDETVQALTEPAEPTRTLVNE